MKITLDYGAYMPERAHKDDAGIDLKTPTEFWIRHGESYVIDTGVHIELPSGTYGRIEGKSGLHMRDIVCHGGTIDVGYTGSIRVKLYNHGKVSYHFKSGDKVAQLVVIPILFPEIEVVERLEETERGDGGFGSTGR